MRFITKITSALVLSFGLANAASYSVDNAHTNVGFSVKHMMITNVKGDYRVSKNQLKQVIDGTIVNYSTDATDLWTHGSAPATNWAGQHNHWFNVTSGATGSGQAFSNLSPYITVYFWKRTK